MPVCKQYLQSFPEQSALPLRRKTPPSGCLAGSWWEHVTWSQECGLEPYPGHRDYLKVLKKQNKTKNGKLRLGGVYVMDGRVSTALKLAAWNDPAETTDVSYPQVFPIQLANVLECSTLWTYSCSNASKNNYFKLSSHIENILNSSLVKNAQTTQKKSCYHLFEGKMKLYATVILYPTKEIL